MSRTHDPIGTLPQSLTAIATPHRDIIATRAPMLPLCLQIEADIVNVLEDMALDDYFREVAADIEIARLPHNVGA